jgi:hypothetical protein
MPAAAGSYPAIAREADGHVLLLAGGDLASELAAARVLDEPSERCVAVPEVDRLPSCGA